MKITGVHAIILRQPEADPFDQAGAEIPLHPLLGGWQGGVVFGGLQLPAMLGVIAPPALSDDGLPGLKVRQGADEGDQPLAVQRGGRFGVAPLRSQAGHREAVVGILKRDALDDATQFTPGWCLGGGEEARRGCGRQGTISESEDGDGTRMVARPWILVTNSTWSR